MQNKNNPYADLVDAVKRARKHSMPLKVDPLTEDGDVRFSVPLTAFDWSCLSLDELEYCLPMLANLIGIILLESNSQAFDSIISSKSYPDVCRKYKHTGFGLKSRGTNLYFYCNSSLLLRNFNLSMAQMLTKEQNEIINVPASKKAQSEDAVTIRSYGDDKSYTVIVSKGTNMEHSIETAISTILEHFGLTKSINVTLGQFQISFEAKDE